VNPVTFNDKIREMLLRSPEGEHKMHRCFPKWNTSPLFLYDEPSNEAETAAIITAGSAHNALEHTPFPVFRLAIKVGETGKPEYGSYKARAVVAKYKESSLAVLGRVDSLLHTKTTYETAVKDHGIMARAEDKHLPLWMYMYNVQQAPYRPDREGWVDFICDADGMFGSGGRWITEGSIGKENLNSLISNFFNGLLKSIAAFLVSANSPNNHIASVVPNQPHRSVEWLKARTHYTLITHGHPANSALIAHGAKVTVDAHAELKRMAHNRRAHQRTLRAARFRYARGKTIWVKATWVGPKEWQDEGGKQIYKILEPVPEAAAAA
jgi:hypothetical protein